MSTDRLIDWLESETKRLLETIDKYWESDFNEQSALPGWTTGALVTHLANHADSVNNQLTGRDSGRRWTIDTGADRPGAVLITDAFDSAARLATTVSGLRAADWGRLIRTPTGKLVTASGLVWLRLREVSVHHVDLGGRFEDLPTDLIDALLADAVRAVRHRADWPALVLRPTGSDKALRTRPGNYPGPIEITGSPAGLLDWVTGRSAGGLLETPNGSLPARPFWI
ncbi:maleylpyruvate isomerase family mycothiol-dependent enzyme [Nocardia sp. CA-129566]|uniref:maleylpyruvate isomerase family mycothiol-dependent enzyme n=1 Tax=Nocardia sp. CA-129566 TaxID=3239976 RepID=UPI003D99F56F